MENRNNRVMTETEYRNRIKKIQKDREIQETLDKVAEESIRKRSTPRRSNPPRPRPALPYSQPIQNLKGLLSPESRPSGFMGLLNTTPKGSKQ